MTDADRTFVLFLDSLGPDDLEKMPWTDENLMTGEMDTRPVYVTPFVLGSVYTGKQPGDNGMPSVSRYEGTPRGRPDGLTIPEIAAVTDQYETVVQMGWPFIVPPQVQDPQGDYYHHSGAMGTASTLPQDVANQITTPQPPGDLDKPDENFDLAFDARIDHAHESFGRMRNFAIESDADVVFFGYRMLDAYTHYRRETDDRDRLLTEIDRQIQYTAAQGDVFIWGDHGSMEMDELFRINRWLIDKGYLDVDIDHEWIGKAHEYGVIEDDESVPGHTLSHESPGVTVNGKDSVAIGADPFSTGITLLEGANPDIVLDLRDDLLDEDAFVDVHVSEESFPGEHTDEFPDLYAERRPGVFVSGNLHPDPGGAELTRTGVHHPYGAFGSTTDLAVTETTPVGLFDEIARGFLDLDVEAARSSESGAGGGEIDADVRGHLEDLGYI